MAIRRLDEVKIPMKLNYAARAVVTKEAILKNRNNELQKLLGRIKELLKEDEVLIIASNDALGEATKRKEAVREIKDVDVHEVTVEIKPEDFMGQWAQLNTNRQQYYYTTNATTTTGYINRQGIARARQVNTWQNLANEVVQE